VSSTARSHRRSSAPPPINQPLGLTVYFWHVQIDQFA
jgi:hypothetical protein